MCYFNEWIIFQCLKIVNANKPIKIDLNDKLYLFKPIKIGTCFKYYKILPFYEDILCSVLLHVNIYTKHDVSDKKLLK